MADAVQQSVENAREAGLLGDEMVSYIVPHQPNGLILSRLQKQLREAHGDAEVCSCIEHMGNTVSASIPSAMSKVQDRLAFGSLVAMPSVGAGGPGYRPDVLSAECVLLRIGKDRSSGPFFKSC
jgi:3-oxoacyl-[acyl-carrier-protein] synthase III